MTLKIPPLNPTVAVSLTVGLTLLGDSMLYSVLPAQYDVFGLPLIAVGLLLSVNRYVRLLTNPLAGWICGRTGIRLPFLAAVAMGALVTIVYGLAPGLIVFAIARLLWGASWSLLRLGGYLTVLHHSTPSRLGRGLGLYNALSRLGSLLGMLVGGILADAIGARPTLIMFSALILLGLPLASSVTLNWGHSQQSVPTRRREPEAGSWRRLIVGEQGGVAGRQIISVHFATLWVGFTAAVITSCLGLLFRLRFGERVDLLGITLGIATLTGIVLASRWVVGVGLTPVYGLLIDRLGRPIVGTAFAVVTVGGLALLAVASNLASIILGALLGFAGCGALIVILESAAGALAPKASRAAAMSRYSTWSDIGSATGPALGYALVGALGLATVYALTALGLIVTTAAFVWTAMLAIHSKNACSQALPPHNGL